MRNDRDHWLRGIRASGLISCALWVTISGIILSSSQGETLFLTLAMIDICIAAAAIGLLIIEKSRVAYGGILSVAGSAIGIVLFGMVAAPALTAESLILTSFALMMPMLLVSTGLIKLVMMRKVKF